MSVEEIIRREKERIEKWVEEEIQRSVDHAKDRLKQYLDDLAKASKIALPVNLIDIMAKGGYVKVADVYQEYDLGNIEVIVSNNVVISIGYVPRGKYRITLIVEKEAEK